MSNFLWYNNCFFFQFFVWVCSTPPLVLLYLTFDFNRSISSIILYTTSIFFSLFDACLAVYHSSPAGVIRKWGESVCHLSPAGVKRK